MNIDDLIWKGPLPPETKYQVMWKGEWRRVVNMFDHGNAPTTLPTRAAKAVIYVTPDYWVAVAVSPGEIVERSARNPDKQYWEYLRD